MDDYVNDSTFPLVAASKWSLHRWIDIPARSETKAEGLAWGQLHSVYVYKCVCVWSHPFICPSVCMCLHFFSRSDPSASRCWCHLLPCQSKATAEYQSLRALVYRQLTCMSVILIFVQCSHPVAPHSHKGRISPQLRYYLSVVKNRHERSHLMWIISGDKYVETA